MTIFRSAVLAAVAALAVCTTACSSAEGGTPTPGDDGAQGSGVDTLAGGYKAWLNVVCKEGSEKSDDVRDVAGDNVTGGWYCLDQFDRGDGGETYVEMYTYDADPLSHWEGMSIANYAHGQASADEWVVFFEDSSAQRVAEPHLGGLEQFGFTVVENQDNG